MLASIGRFFERKEPRLRLVTDGQEVESRLPSVSAGQAEISNVFSWIRESKDAGIFFNFMQFKRDNCFKDFNLVRESGSSSRFIH